MARRPIVCDTTARGTVLTERLFAYGLTAPRLLVGDAMRGAKAFLDVTIRGAIGQVRAAYAKVSPRRLYGMDTPGDC